MEISQNLFKRSLKLVKEWKVPSKSERGKWYLVGLSGNKLFCNCVAGSMYQDCSHKQIVKWKISHLTPTTQV